MTRLLVLTLAFAVSAAARELPDKELVEHIREEIGQGKYVGIIIGLIDGDQTIVRSFGETAKGSGRPPDEHTLFEISSISKTFVASILAELAVRTGLEPTDPVSYYLPRGVQLAAIDGRQITLEDLAVHTAGLPHMPEDYEAPGAINPYSGYTIDDLWTSVNAFSPTRKAGFSHGRTPRCRCPREHEIRRHRAGKPPAAWRRPCRAEGSLIKMSSSIEAQADLDIIHQTC